MIKETQLMEQEQPQPRRPLPLKSLLKLLQPLLLLQQLLRLLLLAAVLQLETLENVPSPRLNSVLASTAGKKLVSNQLIKVCQFYFTLALTDFCSPASFNHGSAQDIDIITRMSMFSPLLN